MYRHIIGIMPKTIAPGTIQNENFNDNAISAAVWDVGTPGAPFTHDAAVTVAEAANKLTITPRSSFASAAYNGYVSDNTYNFTDKYVIVEAPTVPTGVAVGTDMRLVMYVDSSNYIHMAQVNDGANKQITMRVRVAAANSETNVTYNATDHRWWRLRHATSGGHIYFDTSADGSSWTNRRDYTSTLPTLTAMKVAMVGGTFASIATPGTAVFDNFSSDLV